MLTLEQIKRRLEIANHRALARQSGVPHWKISRIANGTSANPRVGAIKELSDYYKELEKESA